MTILRYFALIWLVSLASLTISAPWLPLASFEQIDFFNEAQFPDKSYWLGTDGMGRDMLSRVLHGARVSLAVAIVSPLIGLLVGGVLGLLAGYFRGWLEQLALIMIDTMLAFPTLIFALLAVTYLGPSLVNVILVMGVLSIPAFARIVRGQVLLVVNLEYITAAKSLGVNHGQILVRHILPNIFPAVASFFLTVMATMVVAEGALGFLGLSVPPPQPSWGSMIAEGREYLEDAPHISLIPSMAIFLTLMSLNLIREK
jgi:peptide/nickel transport system permease protein